MNETGDKKVALWQIKASGNSLGSETAIETMRPEPLHVILAAGDIFKGVKNGFAENYGLYFIKPKDHDGLFEGADFFGLAKERRVGDFEDCCTHCLIGNDRFHHVSCRTFRIVCNL